MAAWTSAARDDRADDPGHGELLRQGARRRAPQPPRPRRLLLRLALLGALRGDALGRPGDLQGADQRRRARHLPGQRQPRRADLDGGRHPGRGRGHPRRHRAGTPTPATSPWSPSTTPAGPPRCRRSAIETAPRPGGTAPPGCGASSAARSPPRWSGRRRGRHERLVLGRHRPRHRPRRLRPPRRHGDRRRDRRRRRLCRPAVRAARRLRPHRDRAGRERAGDLRRAHFPNLGVVVGPSGHIGHGAVLHGCRIGRNAWSG